MELNFMNLLTETCILLHEATHYTSIYIIISVQKRYRLKLIMLLPVYGILYISETTRKLLTFGKF